MESMKTVTISPLKLYLVSPVGHEDRGSILVARDEDEAVNKALQHPNILEVVRTGSGLLATDLTKQFDKMGYTLIVAQKDMFH